MKLNKSLAAFVLISIVLALSTMQGDQRTANAFNVVITVHENGLLDVEEHFDYDFGSDGHYQNLNPTIPMQIKTPSGKHQLSLIGNVNFSMDGEPALYSQSSYDKVVNLRLEHQGFTSLHGRHRFIISYQVSPGLYVSGDDMGMRWHIAHWVSIAIAKSTVTVHFPATFTHEQVKSILFDRDGTGAMGTWLNQNTYQAKIESLSRQSSWGFGLDFPRKLMPLVKAQAFLPLKAPHANKITTVPNLKKEHKVNHAAESNDSNLLTVSWDIFLALLPWVILLLLLKIIYSGWSSGRIPDLKNIKVIYNPPEGFEAAHAGLLIDQSMDAVDIAGILIELEQDGYISSSEDEFIRLMKDPDDDLPPYKQLLLKKLFAPGPLLYFSALSRKRKIELNQDIDAVKEVLHRWFVQEGFMRAHAGKERLKKEMNISFILPILILLAYIYTSVRMDHLLGDGLGEGLLKTFMIFTIFIALQMTGISRFQKGDSWGRMLGGGILFLLGTIPEYFLLNAQIPSVHGISGFMQSALLPVTLFFFAYLRFYKDLPLRTAKGAKTYIQLLGYKEFLQRVEAGKLEINANEKDKALSFAVAMGLKEHWYSKLSSLLLVLPEENSRHEGDALTSDFNTHFSDLD